MKLHHKGNINSPPFSQSIPFTPLSSLLLAFLCLGTGVHIHTHTHTQTSYHSCVGVGTKHSLVRLI